MYTVRQSSQRSLRCRDYDVRGITGNKSKQEDQPNDDPGMHCTASHLNKSRVVGKALTSDPLASLLAAIRPSENKNMRMYPTGCIAVAVVGIIAAAAIMARADNTNDGGDSDDIICPCRVLERPDLFHKELRARWMVHTLDWGVLSTVNSRLPSNPPFGNVYSFVDGPCDSSSGVPYFYGTYLDSSFQDMKANPAASFTLSEASFASVCGGKSLAACDIVNHGHHHMYASGDPESPICARLNLSGRIVPLEEGSDEYAAALEALYQRHRQMADWPAGHKWIIAKLEIEDIWFIGKI